MLQQPTLDVQRVTAAVVHEAAHASFAHHAMTGDNDRNGIGATGLPYRTRTGIQLQREVTVMAGLSGWDGGHSLPHFGLVGSAVELEGQVEMKFDIFEIGHQLLARGSRKSVDRQLRRCARRKKFYAGQRIRFTADAQHAEWGSEFSLIIHDAVIITQIQIPPTPPFSKWGIIW